MSATKIPFLTLDNLHCDPHGMSHLVVWGNQEISRFVTLPGAKATMQCERHLKHDVRSNEARLFSWDGETWPHIP